MVISAVMTLVVPKMLGIEEYAYWQLYTFYISYIGFFHLGWIDGIYLKIGGYDYKDLDKRKYGTQFWVLNFLEVLILFIISMVVLFNMDDPNKKLILLMTGVCGVITIAKTFFLYIMQATNRIRDYAKYTKLDRYIYFIAVMAALFLGVRTYPILLFLDVISKFIVVVLCAYSCKDLVFIDLLPFKDVVGDIFDNITVGMKLMLANIASMLIIGVVRLGIERQWDITTFGKVSLTLSISNLLMVFINAVGIIMFPLLRRTSRQKLPSLYSTLRTVLMVPMLLMLVFYYPAKIILSSWLPQYADSLIYMALLFPLCVYESKMAMIVNTYLKALRKERQILLVNISTVILSVASTFITIIVLQNLPLAIVSIVFLLAFRCIFAEILIAEFLGISVIKDIILELSMTVIFITSSWFIGGIPSVVIYMISYLGYLIIKKKDISQMVASIKILMGKKEETNSIA
jgi:O-antigen/teichoic acid export membrane protein